MASQFGTIGALNGMFKIVYGDSLESFLPKSTLAQQLIKFNSAKQIGKTYNFPVLIQTENGLTFSADSGDAPVEVNVANSLVSKEAAVEASLIIGEAAISYKSAERGRTSKQAFENVVGLKVKEHTTGIRKGLEMALWSGQDDLGTAVGQPTSTDANTATITLSGTAPGFWNAGVGMQIVLYTGSVAGANANFGPTAGYNGTVSRTVSSNGLDQSAATGLFTVKSFVPGNLSTTVTVTGHATDITLLTGTSQAGNRVYRFGMVAGSGTGFTFNSTAGFEKILTNNGSLYGIDASAYDAWKATSVAINAAASVSNITDAVAQAWARGLEDDLVLFVNPAVFQVLANSTDILGRRQMDSSYSKKVMVGVESITLVGLNGNIEVVPSQYCKRDIAIGVVPKYWSRVGSTDFSLLNPGGSDGSVFFHSETKGGVAFRGVTDQGLVCMRPMVGGLILTGIA